MAFDLNSAKPITSEDQITPTFDLKSAVPDIPLQKNYKLSQVPGAMIENTPQSARNMLEGIVNVGKLLYKGATSGLSRQESDAIALGIVNLPEFFWNRWGGDSPAAAYENIKRTLAEDPVGAIADISGVLSAGGGILSKAGELGNISTLSKAGSVIEKTGKIAGLPINAPLEIGTSVIGKTAGLIGKGSNFVRNAMNPKSMVYLNAAEGQGPELINALNTYSPSVPGYKPTAAEAATGVDNTSFQALGKKAEAVAGTPYYIRRAENKNALIDAFGPEENITGLIEQRDAIAKQNFENANMILSKVDTEFKNILSGPTGRKALERAAGIAADERKPFIIGDISTGKAKLSADSVGYIKRALDDMIKDPGELGGKQIADVRRDFIKWADTRNPFYAGARSEFAKQSQPISQLEVGRYLKDKLTPALGEDSAKLRANAYVTALDNAPGTISKATDSKVYDNLEQILTPTQMKVVNDVRKDLENSAKAEAMASNAGTKAKNVLMNPVPNIQAPSMLNRVITVANNIFARSRGVINEKLAMEIAMEMLNPETAAGSLEKALKFKTAGNNRAAAASMIGKGVESIVLDPTFPSAVNALNNKENQ